MGRRKKKRQPQWPEVTCVTPNNVCAWSSYPVGGSGLSISIQQMMNEMSNFVIVTKKIVAIDIWLVKGFYDDDTPIAEIFASLPYDFTILSCERENRRAMKISVEVGTLERMIKLVGWSLEDQPERTGMETIVLSFLEQGTS